MHDLTEEVHLLLPARPELIGVARLTAASLAGTIDFSLDEIEDLKIAVAELVYHLMGPDGHGGSLALTYRVSLDQLEITGSGPGYKNSNTTSSHPLSSKILVTVTDDYELDLTQDHARFRLIKNRGV